MNLATATVSLATMITLRLGPMMELSMLCQCWWWSGDVLVVCWGRGGGMLVMSCAGGVRVLANGQWFGDLGGAQLTPPRKTTTASESHPVA